MGKQLQLFNIPPLIPQELIDLLHGSDSFQVGLEISISQKVNKLALFIECITRSFKDCIDLEWWFEETGVYKKLFSFNLLHLKIEVYEYASDEFWLCITHGEKTLVDVKFDQWNGDETWEDKNIEKTCISCIYKNSFQFTNVLKDIY